MTDMSALPQITATEVSAPPAWALLERNLIAQMEEGARFRFRQCTERGGAILYAEDFDDLFEQFYNWGLFYAMGADDSVLEMAATAWNATVRISDENIVHRTRFNDHKKVFRPSARREFWNLNQAMEWHHLGEGMMAFYDFGVADPTISEMARRAQLFAGFYTGEDPEAPNYDPEHKILRSPFQSSEGPLQKVGGRNRARHAPCGALAGQRSQLLRRPRQSLPDRGRPRARLVGGPGATRGDRRSVQQADFAVGHTQQLRCHSAGDPRLPVHGGREVQTLGAGVHRGVDGAGRAERRHHA